MRPVDALRGEQKPAQLVAVETSTFARVDFGAADVLGGVGGDASVDVSEAVEPAHRRQAAINRRRGQSALFHVLAVQLDVSSGRGQDLEPDDAGPIEETAEVLPVGVQGPAVVAGQERHRGDLRFVEDPIVDTADHSSS